MASGHNVASTAAKPLLTVAEREGLSRAELVARLGVPEDALNDPDARMEVDRYLDLWEHAARSLRDARLPVWVAEATEVEDYHLLGFALITSATGRELIERLMRYSRLHTNSDRWSLHETPRAALIRLTQPGVSPRLGVRLVNECLFAKATSILRRTAGGPGLVRFARFKHAAPEDLSPLALHLGVVPEFNAVENELGLAPAFLSMPLKTGNRRLGEYILSEAERRLEQIDETPTVERVRAEVTRLLASGEPTLRNVTRQLAMSERSLRRHLAREGTTFREILDDVRRDRATELLRRSASMNEVAEALGFAETSGFGRAFRRWFGVSPRAARSRL